MNDIAPPPVVPKDAFHRRIRKVQQKLSEQKLDAVLLFAHEDIAYLTGYYAHLPWYPADLFRLAPLIVFKDKEPLQVTTLVMTRRFKRQAAIERIASYDEYADSGFDFLEKLFVEEGLTKARVGYDPEKVVVHTIDGMRERAPGIEWVDASHIMPSIRAIKDNYEIEFLRRACDINRAGLKAAVETAKPGEREHYVAAMAEHAMRVAGAERFTEETMILSGEHVFDTRDRGSPERTIVDNGFLIADMGAVFGGYCSDQATTVFLGTPTKDQKSLMDLAREVYASTLAKIRPGMRACDIDGLAREHYQRSDLEGAHLPHLVGHGVGLEFHEVPLLKPGVETIVEPGMTFTFEPAVRWEGVGAVRFEEIFLMTEEGVEKL